MYLGYTVSYAIGADSEDDAEEEADRLLGQDMNGHNNVHFDVVDTDVVHEGGDAYTVTFEVEVTADASGRGESDALRKFDGKAVFDRADHVNEV